MNTELPIVGLDTCILVEGIAKTEYGLDRNVCPVVLELFRFKVLRLQLYAQVEKELDPILEGLEKTGHYPPGWLRVRVADFLTVVDRVKAIEPTRADVDQDMPALLALMRDPPDSTIAVAVKKNCPDYFISNNPKHWIDNPEKFGTPLGGRPDAPLGKVQIMTAAEFCRAMGVPIPPPRKPVPRALPA